MNVKVFQSLVSWLPFGRHSRPSVVLTMGQYMEGMIGELQRHGNIRSAEIYRTVLNSFRQFRNGKDVPMESFDSELILQYISYLKGRDLCPNTISFYLKRLRTVYNKMVDEGLVEDCRPFRKLSMSSEKTVKRAISLRYIRRLKFLNLEPDSSQAMARDMFLLSFYMRGMSFVDMAYLRKTDLKDGVLSYRRRKTGQLLYMRWEPCMEKLALCYAAAPSSPYLLSIIRNADGNTRRQYQSALVMVNRHLKELGRIIRSPLPLTMYVARHSWATIAREEGIPISVISEGMGHESENTTQIYLASLENTVIDNANRKILNLLWS